MLVVGEKEAEAGTVTVRKRTGGEQAVVTVEEFISDAQRLIRTRALNL